MNVWAVAEKRIGEGSGRGERVETSGFYRLTSDADFQMEIPGRQIHESKWRCCELISCSCVSEF